MKSKRFPARRLICLLLTLCLLVGTVVSLASCSGSSEIPEGYQYATCNGEYFRLFLPTQWTVNTESGVSGGYTNVFADVAVSMVEVPFTVADIVEAVPTETVAETPAETVGESSTASDTDADTSVSPASEPPAETVADATTAETVAETVAETTTETVAETAASERVATLADFFNAHMADVQKLQNYKHEKTSDTTMNASEGGKRAAAKDVTYTVTIASTTYRYRQVLCKVEGRFYLFTCSYNVAYYDAMPESQQLKLTAMVEEILGNVVFHAVPFDGGKHDKKQPNVEAPAGMKLVSSKDVPYLFFAPESWIEVPGSAASQVYASESDRSNVSVIGIVPEDEGTGIDDYWKKTQLHYESALENFTLVSTTEGETIDGRVTIIYEYTYSLGGVDYHARQAVCAYSLMLVSMTYTAVEENYAAHLDEVKAMQDAIRFRAPIIG